MIYGLSSCNCDALALWAGAARVIIVDYNRPVCQHERITIMTHEEIMRARIKADIAISFSSFEHDGLGRYGDPLAPEGDLAAMRFAAEVLAPEGVMYFGVPLGSDSIRWNNMRVYGRLRLPLLLVGWECLDIFCGRQDGAECVGIFDNLRTEEYIQPLMILRRLDSGTKASTSLGDTSHHSWNPQLLSEIREVLEG